MKHLLNNISEEEKNSIREQHSGGMKLMNEKFQQMVDKKLGHVNLYEQTSLPEDSGENEYRKKSGIKLPAIKSEEDLIVSTSGHLTYISGEYYSTDNIYNMRLLDTWDCRNCSAYSYWKRDDDLF